MKKYLIGELFDGEEKRIQQAIITDGEKIIWTGSWDSSELLDFHIEETFDFSQHFVMPGLIDCHVHIASLDHVPQTPAEWALATLQAVESLKELRSAGVVACRDLGSCGGLTIGISKAQRENRISDFPLVISAGRALVATGGHGYDIGLECDGVNEFSKGARLVIKEGTEIVKVMMSGGVNSPGTEPGPPEVNFEEIEAVVKEAHARGRKVAVHAHGNTAIKRSVMAGVDSIEHGVFNSLDIMKMMVENGTVLVPTLSAPYWATLEGIRQQPDNPDHKKSREVVENHNKVTHQAFFMGIQLAMGTDAGCPFNPFDKAYQELILLHKIGIGISDVLRIATKNGADLLGQTQLGSISEGKEASFIAIEKSPYDSIEAIALPKKVWIKGVRVV